MSEMYKTIHLSQPIRITKRTGSIESCIFFLSFKAHAHIILFMLHYETMLVLRPILYANATTYETVPKPYLPAASGETCQRSFR